MVESEDPDLDTCPLVGRDDVLLTPHSGYYSDTSNYLVAKLSMDNALYYVNGEYDKVKAIRFLSDNGAFLVTKSGDKVAKYFGISKYTLYSYIDANKDGDK